MVHRDGENVEMIDKICVWVCITFMALIVTATVVGYAAMWCTSPGVALFLTMFALTAGVVARGAVVLTE